MLSLTFLLQRVDCCHAGDHDLVDHVIANVRRLVRIVRISGRVEHAVVERLETDLTHVLQLLALHSPAQARLTSFTCTIPSKNIVPKIGNINKESRWIYILVA